MLAFSGGAINVSGRKGHLHFHCTEDQSKFTRSGKLVILPALVITVLAETGIPLCYSIIIITILRKMFIPASGSAETHKITPVGQFVIPVNFKNKLLSRLQGSRQI